MVLLLVHLPLKVSVMAVSSLNGFYSYKLVIYRPALIYTEQLVCT